MAAVILGGLTSSTLLNLLVIPTLFARFGVVGSVDEQTAPAPVRTGE